MTDFILIITAILFIMTLLGVWWMIPDILKAYRESKRDEKFHNMKKTRDT